MLKASKINKDFAEYLLNNSFITLSDMATKGYSSINNDKYNKILANLGLEDYTQEPVVEVTDYYKNRAGKRTKREN